MKVGRGSPSTMVRLPQELKDQIKHLAIDNRRSINGEIVFRLEESVKAAYKNDQPKPA